MIKAKKMEDRGMKVVNVDLVIHGRKAKFVGGAMDVSAASTAAGKPHREAIMIVVAPGECR